MIIKNTTTKAIFAIFLNADHALKSGLDVSAEMLS